MSKEVHELPSIDHRTVQGVHDLVAAWYRFKRRTEHLFPLGGDLRWDWLSFLAEEVESLSHEPDFVTGVLDACIQANTDTGYAGEKPAQSVQRSRYARMLSYALPDRNAGEMTFGNNQGCNDNRRVSRARFSMPGTVRKERSAYSMQP